MLTTYLYYERVFYRTTATEFYKIYIIYYCTGLAIASQTRGHSFKLRWNEHIFAFGAERSQKKSVFDFHYMANGEI